uniref:Uncharacterized protein n=1 Tax=Entomoneis paludosa TaxID=265537 RepID=A0A7S2Y482_9STRA
MRVEGLSFVMSGLIPLLSVHFGYDTPKTILRLAIVVWINSAPSALLVSAVVKYVLWEHMVRTGNKMRENFRRPIPLLQHNFNAIAILIEVGLLGKLPCRFQDFAVAPLFGTFYVVFTWCTAYCFGNLDRYGPQFRYPFLDTTLGMFTTIAVVALLLVFMSFFCILALAEQVLSIYIGGGFVGHAVAVAIFSLSVCRFRD